METRDTTNWYLSKDPMVFVSDNLIEFVRERAGKKILDLGCGVGGYSRRLEELGFELVAADINPQYVEVARGLGLETVVLETGKPLPFADNEFDTVIMLEVLEHLADPGSLVGEAARVTSDNLLITVPNCTMRDALAGAGLFFEHELDQDHRNTFTAGSLHEFLSNHFSQVEVIEGEFMDERLYPLLLPDKMSRKADRLLRQGKLKPRLSFRLFAEAR